MVSSTVLRAGALVAVLLSVTAEVSVRGTHHGALSASSAAVGRGRYLVGAAGQCTECHGEKLQGASLNFIAPNAPPVVQRKAPKIAGLPMFADASAATDFFETGQLPGKAHARPPMPRYRFNHYDAVAIVAYLKTLR